MEVHVNEFLASLDAQPDYSESTRMAYGSDMRVFLDYLRDKLNRSPKLTDLNTKQVADFLDAERKNGRRHSTLIRRLATLRRFTVYLQHAGVLEKEFFDTNGHLIDEALESVKPSRSPTTLTATQIDRLWAAIEKSQRLRARRDESILTLLLETGLSVGTLVALNLSDLDLSAGKLHLTTEGGRDVWLPLGQATEPLKRYLEEGRRDLNPQQDEQALFISQMGGRISRQGIWQILRYWGKATEPPIDLSPRVVRHTAALRLSRSGRPLSEIQALLGHSNPLSTQALLRRLEAVAQDGDFPG
ncbi:MAG TPA: tyrosine-type recombinase/integrase [Anaerolineales bacterium]|nr:tyrosine-type recombinase/integrase [Anaerolineales bacterium]